MRIFVVSNLIFKCMDYFIKVGRSFGVDICFVIYDELLVVFFDCCDMVVKLEFLVFWEVDFWKYNLFCEEYRSLLF